eukprot:1959950-Pyramimonas_sp.AAC.1
MVCPKRPCGRSQHQATTGRHCSKMPSFTVHLHHPPDPHALRRQPNLQQQTNNKQQTNNTYCTSTAPCM